MTYATMATHISPVVHYFFAFLVLFILLPKFLFSTSYVGWTDRLFAAYVKMILVLILSGYFLVITKLYEILSLMVLFIVIIGYRYIKQRQGKKTITLLNDLFNLLDGLLTIKLSDVKKKMLKRANKYKKRILEKFSWNLLFEGLALVIVIGGSSYLRFYDAFANAAPAMSDSYVTLAWMKYIDARQLFHDGIYPQGFHIYLATVFKFAAVDALYVLRYTGPINSVLFTLGLYMVIRKLTKSAVGAIFAAFIYGVYWVSVPIGLLEMERQVATNSQEFAFIFIFPAVYFFVNYLLHKHKEDLTVGLVCVAIIGLVHSLIFAFIGMLLGILIVSALLTLRVSWKPVVHLCIGALLTVVISLVPLGVGLLLGKEFHSSSAEYLIDRKESTYTYPDLSYVDYSTLAFCILLFLFLFIMKNTREDRFIGLFTILAGGSVFILYFGGGTWTQSTLIESRARELWGLVIPFCVGISISYLFKWLKEKWHSILYISLFVLVLSTMALYKPTPIIPYKLEHKENIEQYMKIRRDYLPKTWMIVSQAEGYSVALGTGYHMHLGDFLQNYRPEGKALTRRDNGTIEMNLAQDVFVFMEKDVFQVSESNVVYELLKPEYARRIKEYRQLADWMKVHKEAGYDVTTYFENENIQVFHFKTAKDKPSSINIWSR